MATEGRRAFAGMSGSRLTRAQAQATTTPLIPANAGTQIIELDRNGLGPTGAGAPAGQRGQKLTVAPTQ